MYGVSGTEKLPHKDKKIVNHMYTSPPELCTHIFLMVSTSQLQTKFFQSKCVTPFIPAKTEVLLGIRQTLMWFQRSHILVIKYH